MRHFGLMIVDDDELTEQWLRLSLRYFDEVVCLVGSQGCAVRQAAASGKVYRIEASRSDIVAWTDHGLRDVAHRAIVDRHGTQGWITLCHPNEYFYHDPRKCCALAERFGCDGVSWYATRFVPHVDELKQWRRIRDLPLHERCRRYYWSPSGTQRPAVVFRSYRNLPHMQWEPEVDGNTEPIGCVHLAPFHPILRHYVTLHPSDAAWAGGKRSSRSTEDRVLHERRPFDPRPCFESQFVDGHEDNVECGFFDGVFDQEWNMGEELR